MKLKLMKKDLVPPVTGAGERPAVNPAERDMQLTPPLED